jgi:hypothetical protein
MEGTFSSAKNQYQSNYVQHALTGEDKYKQAYEAAQNTMESILEKAPPQEPESLKTIEQKTYQKIHQVPVSSIPSQNWKYWTLGTGVLVSFVLSMF